MTIQTRRLTLNEFHALPEGPPHFELEEGELLPMTSPTSRHQEALLVFTFALRQHVRDGRLGRVFMEIDVYFPDDTAYIPDITFLSNERLPLHRADDQKIHGVPDLVVELTSSAPARDRVDKFRVYYDNGVPWYWIIDPEALTVEEYQWTPQGYLRTASVAAREEFRPKRFDGLALNLAQLVGLSAPPPPPAAPAQPQ